MYSCKCGNVVVQTRARAGATAPSGDDTVVVGMLRVELGLGGVHVGFAPLVACAALRDGWRIYKCGNVCCGMNVFAIPENEHEFEAPLNGRGLLQLASTTLAIASDLLRDDKAKQPETSPNYCPTFKMVLPQVAPGESISELPSESQKRKVSQMADYIIASAMSTEKSLMEQRIAAYIATEREKLRKFEDRARGDKVRLLKSLQGTAGRQTLKSALSDAMANEIVDAEDDGEIQLAKSRDIGGDGIAYAMDSVASRPSRVEAEDPHQYWRKSVRDDTAFQQKPTKSPKKNRNSNSKARVSIGGVTTIISPVSPMVRVTEESQAATHDHDSQGGLSQPVGDDVFGMDGLDDGGDRLHGVSQSTEPEESDDDLLVTGRFSSSSRRESRDGNQGGTMSTLATSLPITMQRRSIPLDDLASDDESDRVRARDVGCDDDTDRLAKSFAEASMMAQMNDSTSIFGVMPPSHARRRGFTFQT